MIPNSMTRWAGRYALVTGASYGLGAAFARVLTEHGVHVIGCARDAKKIEALAAEFVKAGHKGLLHAYQADLTQEPEIVTMFEWIKSNFGGVDILINNAGICSGESILEHTDLTRQMMQVNVVAVMSCVSKAVASMQARGVDDGHIFHLNSVTGHEVHNWGNVHPYSASKWAITSLNEGLRQELNAKGSKIRVTSLSPGITDTPLIRTAFGTELRDKLVLDTPSLKPEEIADMVIFALSLPAHITIHELTVRATGNAI